MAASFDLPQQTLTCLKNCGFVLKQIELLYVYYPQYVKNNVKRILAVTSWQAKASQHSDVSLNNIFYSHATKKNLPLAYKLRRSSPLAYTTAILQSIISCYHGLFCPIKAPNARAIMNGQHYDKINKYSMESSISASPTLSSYKFMECMPYLIVSTLEALQWSSS